MSAADIKVIRDEDNKIVAYDGVGFLARVAGHSYLILAGDNAAMQTVLDEFGFDFEIDWTQVKPVRVTKQSDHTDKPVRTSRGLLTTHNADARIVKSEAA